MWNSIQKWLASKGGISHVVAGIFTALVAAYGMVPSFASLVNSVYAVFPAWAHEIVLAGIGLAAWYKNTQTGGVK